MSMAAGVEFAVDGKFLKIGEIGCKLFLGDIPESKTFDAGGVDAEGIFADGEKFGVSCCVAAFFGFLDDGAHFSVPACEIIDKRGLSNTRLA